MEISNFVKDVDHEEQSINIDHEQINSDIKGEDNVFVEYNHNEKNGELHDLFGSDDDDNTNNGVVIDNLENNDNNKTIIKNNELDDLLGSDDENNDNVPIIEIKGNSKSKNELDDLLGEDEEEDNNNSNNFIEKEEIYKDVDGFKRNELDQLLGDFSNENDYSQPSDKEEKKSKTHSKLYLHESLRIKESQSRFFVRTPNFIKINPTLYDSLTYDEEREKTIHDGSAAIVRYRIKRDELGDIIVDTNNQPVYESNSRLVKYEDGTYQLVVGKAVFNSKIVPANGCYIFQEQSIIKDDPEDEDIIQDSSCLECVGEAGNRMILQPASLDSETHTRMSLKISERFKKDNKISIHDYEKVVEKPEVTLALLAKKEEEQIRKEMKQRMQSSDYRSSNYGNESRFFQQSRPSMSTSYLNDESQFDGDNIGDLKGSFKGNKTKGKKPFKRYDDEDDLDDFIEEDEEEEDEEGNIEGLSLIIEKFNDIIFKC